MLNHGFDWGPDDGGNEGIAIAYLARWSGPVTESADPYDSPQKYNLAPAYHVQDVDHLPNSPAVIKQALIKGGALDTSIYSDAMDSDYYFNSDTAALYYDGSNQVDHDVAIVGWDDNYDRSNFNNQPPGDGAWIIKNSWGTEWGDDGYFYLSYYDSYAGNNVTAFHNAEATENYNRIYQYDPLGQTTVKGYIGSNSAWGANIFTASANDSLTAVSTYTLSPNASLQINVYTNVNPGEPESGQLQSSKTVTIPFNGYHTIALDQAVALTAGQRFSIVVNYTTPGYSYPLPVEEALFNYSSEATATAGQSFISYESGGPWKDISQSEYVNVCIKGFTETAAPTEPGIGVFTGFLGQDPYGNYYLYNKDEFNNSYLAYQINPSLAVANMYKHYRNNDCRIVALKDLNKGYMDYEAAATASLLAQINQLPFDINAYFGRSDARLYGGTVIDVMIVDINGTVFYE